MNTRSYQLLVTFFSFLGTLPEVVVQLPIQFATKIFVLRLLKIGFHGDATSIKKMPITLQLLVLDAKIFFLNMQDTQVSICSQYITAQFFK